MILILLVVGFGIVVVGGFYLVSARTVTLILDGDRLDTRTHQQTVTGWLAELQVTLTPLDTLSPPGDTPIQNGLVVTVNRAPTVLIEADGQHRQVSTRSTDPPAILAEAGIKLGPHDTVRVDGAEWKPAPYAVAPNLIQIIRAFSIRLDDDGSISTAYTVHRTVGETLHDAGTLLYLADTISPAVDTTIHDGDTITIRRSVPVTIQVDGHTLNMRTHGKTVGEMLAETGIAPVGLDYAVPDITAALNPGSTVRLIRVTEENVVISQSTVDFKRVVQADPTLPMDTRQVIQQGIAGIIEQQVHVRREDGVEVSRSAIENVIVQAARDEITAVGTLPEVKTVDSPDGPVPYWRVLKMRAASYKPSSAGRDSADPLYGVTASGQKLKKGVVAVDPAVIPLGTMLYVPGYGKAIAADTGGAVTGLIIDLGYGDDDYQEWSGIVDVYLLPPVPPAEQIPVFEETPSS